MTEYSSEVRELVELLMQCEQACNDDGDCSVLNYAIISEGVKKIIFDITGKRVGK